MSPRSWFCLFRLLDSWDCQSKVFTRSWDIVLLKHWALSAMHAEDKKFISVDSADKNFERSPQQSMDHSFQECGALT